MAPVSASLSVEIRNNARRVPKRSIAAMTRSGNNLEPQIPDCSALLLTFTITVSRLVP